MSEAYLIIQYNYPSWGRPGITSNKFNSMADAELALSQLKIDNSADSQKKLTVIAYCSYDKPRVD